MKTMHQLAKEAIDIQNACNLSGVIQTWSRSISALKELNPTMSTDELNHHPISVMYASKVGSMTSDDEQFAEAYKRCCELAMN
jgi:hypothetical protein